MIKLRPRSVAPQVLLSATTQALKAGVQATMASGVRLKSADFVSLWSDPELKRTIWEMHRGKCCYCERKRDRTREPDVEHFRPKAMVTEDPSHPGYWWLAYEWSNYLFACKYCNQEYKKNHFPLVDETSRARGQGDDLALEKPWLIDPVEEDPEDFLGYDWQKLYGILVKPVGIDPSGRGAKTIKILGLDRPELNEERAHLVCLLQLLADTFVVARQAGNANEQRRLAAQIREETTAERVFAGFRRAFFRARGLEEHVAND